MTAEERDAALGAELGADDCGRPFGLASGCATHPLAPRPLCSSRTQVLKSHLSPCRPGLPVTHAKRSAPGRLNQTLP